MSRIRKRQMSMAAAAKTQADHERAARRLIEATDCPFVVVYAASGAPGTENSFLCLFRPGIPGLSPTCESGGRVSGPVGCSLLRELRKRGQIRPFLALRASQTALHRYERRVDGSVGWWTGPGINEDDD
jgi:hypothetical protein